MGNSTCSTGPEWLSVVCLPWAMQLSSSCSGIVSGNVLCGDVATKRAAGLHYWQRIQVVLQQRHCLVRCLYGYFGNLLFCFSD